MKNPVAFDVETIADPLCLPIMPEIKVNKSLKDPVKIKADIEDKKSKQIREMGLEPMTNLICCISFCDSKMKPQSISIKEPTHKAEKVLIEKSWKIFEQYDHFVTFNGRAFDVRCIHLGCLLHDIRPSVLIDKGKYNRAGENHTDLRPILAGPGDFAKGKLDFFCKKFLGVGKLEGIDGEMVQDYFDNGLIDDIVTYCEDDSMKTFKLFLKVVKAGLME